MVSRRGDNRSVLRKRKETRNCEVRGYEARREEDGVTGDVCERQALIGVRALRGDEWKEERRMLLKGNQ